MESRQRHRSTCQATAAAAVSVTVSWPLSLSRLSTVHFRRACEAHGENMTRSRGVEPSGMTVLSMWREPSLPMGLRTDLCGEAIVTG